MAEIIPDRLPDGCREFEGILRDAISGLPDEHFAYREVVENTPLYLIVGESLGVMAVAVCPWKPDQIREVRDDHILLSGEGNELRVPHPLRLAVEFLRGLQVRCQVEPDLRRLLLSDGQFGFPTAPVAAFTKTLRQRLGTELSALPSISRDELISLNTENNTAKIAAKFKEFLPKIKTPMTKRQVDALRALVHPEIRLTPATAAPSAQNIDIAVLDLKQERHAQALGTGHRIIYGVAGSGKTVLLLARAKIVAKQHSGDSSFRALFLCFNVSLAAWLKSQLRDYPSIEVRYFDEWAPERRIVRGDKESNDSLGRRLLIQLQETAGYRPYDAVFIDEAQDFSPNWFRCVLAAMKDPDEGDLVIVGDASQGLYRQIGVRWSDLGVRAQGRTISARFDLHKNYRNTREIMELAKVFAATPSGEANDEEQFLALEINTANARRSIDFRPTLHCMQHRGLERNLVVTIVTDLLSGKWDGKPLPGPLLPQEIGVLYPNVYAQDQNEFRALVAALRSIPHQGHNLGVTWLTESRANNRTRVNDPTLKVQTIHSAKGLQYRAVIIVWADQLPQNFRPDHIEEEERRLMFVGITRAQDFLAITCSRKEPPSSFIEEIRRSGTVDNR